MLLNKKQLKNYSEDRGSLHSINMSFIPYNIKRIFWIEDTPKNIARGGHAHIVCLQTYICIKGKIKLFIDDGNEQQTMTLSPGELILIPPLIWTRQIFETGEDVLLVLCSEEYNLDDYLYTLEDVKNYKKNITKREIK